MNINTEQTERNNRRMLIDLFDKKGRKSIFRVEKSIILMLLSIIGIIWQHKLWTIR